MRQSGPKVRESWTYRPAPSPCSAKVLSISGPAVRTGTELKGMDTLKSHSRRAPVG